MGLRGLGREPSRGPDVKAAGHGGHQRVRLGASRASKRTTSVSWLPKEMLQDLVATHGYWSVALVVGLESMGIPLPGETVLVLAAIYAQYLFGDRPGSYRLHSR
jgi:hypothetical protein